MSGARDSAARDGESFMGELAEQVTQILDAIGAGNEQAAEKLLPLGDGRAGRAASSLSNGEKTLK
jgi:DNA-binding GntR family transcriptional regulator